MSASAFATSEAPETLASLKDLALRGDPQFFPRLREQTMAATSAEEVLALAALRSRAERKGHIARHGSIRLAILGGYTFRPLDQLLEHYLSTSAPAPLSCELLLGDFDNYTSEIVDEGGRLGEFKPEVVVLVPSHRSCRYSGPLFDSRDKVEAEARNLAAQILDLCSAANRRTGAEIILANFPLSGQIDPGPYRGRTFASEWSFRKLVNLELGIQAPAYVHICDVEFLSARHGIQNAFDPRAWFETRQPYERGLMLSVARELAHLITHLRTPSKKVAILDLDNTLWGGVIGDDGLNGIEIGDTSPRGEAFKWFQQYLLSLSQRGVLLAACSKNDHDKAIEPFERHPEMVLRMKDFVSFKANWQPKSENIRQIAAELNLGLDSMVFIDDNPAEVDIVRCWARIRRSTLRRCRPAASSNRRVSRPRIWRESANTSRRRSARCCCPRSRTWGHTSRPSI